MNFYPGHVDSAVIHKNKEENAKTDYFYLKTSCEFDILVYKEVDSNIYSHFITIKDINFTAIICT